MSVILALLIDWFVGEPPLRVHPVVWFGNYLKLAERLRSDRFPLVLGGITFLLGVGIVLGIVGGLSYVIGHFPLPMRILLTGILLKPAFAFRMLVREVMEIELALQQDLEQGRKRLAYIVSRDTTVLSAIEVRESALESVSENLSDSVIAPLFWFLVGGLPGAYIYRFVNTADAMWGYRNEKYEQWGKIAARTDDILNWIPARITGLWLLYFPVGMRIPRPQPPRSTTNSDSTIGHHHSINNDDAIGKLGQIVDSINNDDTIGKLGSIVGLRGLWARNARPYGLLCTESRKTPSPNSGWSMAAFALRLGVHLGKPGVYVLNPQGDDVDADIAIAGIHWITRAGWVLVLLIAIISISRFEFTAYLHG